MSSASDPQKRPCSVRRNDHCAKPCIWCIDPAVAGGYIDVVPILVSKSSLYCIKPPLASPGLATMAAGPRRSSNGLKESFVLKEF